MPTSRAVPSANTSASSKSSKRHKTMASSKERPKPRSPKFLDLPPETQKQIIGSVNRNDLFALQRVSSHLFSLACAEIYRDLDLNITNSEAEEGGSRGSHAAEALQTILASEYDYGQHIKSFRLGVMEDNIDLGLGNLRTIHHDPHLMTRLLWDSKSDSSKFLNMTMLLMTRKASILETFQWDAPIELSGAVYKALHAITSLRHLRVRLDVSPSPKMIIRQGLPPGSHPPNIHHPPPIHNTPGNSHPSQWVSQPPIPIGSSNSHAGLTAAKLNSAKRKKAGGSGGCNYWANGRAFSGFKTLSTLTLMGMSNLDCLPEIADCIKASSASLKALTLSLSTELARKARKPVAANPELGDDASDTELEDDDDPLASPPPLPSATQSAPSTNEADIRKEKLAQESILAKIFDLMSVSAEGKKLEKDLSLSSLQSEEDAQAVTRKANGMMKTLIDAPVIQDTEPSSDKARLEHYKMIREVADLYITGHTVVSKKPLKEPNKPSAPAPKKASMSAKPLNPLASGFKPSVFTTKPPGPLDYDFSNVSSPTSPLFGLDTGSSVPLPNAPYKSHPTTGSFPINSPPVPSFTGDNKSNPAPSQSYMSPYVANSYPIPTSTIPPYPYEPSPVSSTSPYTWTDHHHPHTSTNGPITLSQPACAMSSQQITALQNAQSGMYPEVKKGKAKVQTQKKSGPAKIVSIASSDDESETATKTPSPAQPVFFPADPVAEADDETMDVDMEHPDEESAELGEDQEIVAGSDDVEVATPRKRAKVGSEESNSANAASTGPSIIVGKRARAPETLAISSDEAMQAYIRATHGLQLEELSLEWVPLKASIVARALDLSVLKRITLLEVGSQDAFWTLLWRLQGTSTEIRLKSIHTDNVSPPFIKFLGTYEGLEELFMYERKQDADSGAPPAATMSIVRKMALQRHIGTLKRLMIKNDRNELWDVDTKTLRFLALRGAGLKELAISLNMKTYHVLMQVLPGFKNLYALHLITLRSTDRNPLLQQESLNFAVDSLTHCPELRIRYIALITYVVSLEYKPEQFRKHLKMVMERRKDMKGKGKAPLLKDMEDSGSEEVDEVLSDVMAGDRKLRFTTSFSEVKDVKIFSKEIRMGRL